MVILQVHLIVSLGVVKSIVDLHKVRLYASFSCGDVSLHLTICFHLRIITGELA